MLGLCRKETYEGVAALQARGIVVPIRFLRGAPRKPGNHGEVIKSAVVLVIARLLALATGRLECSLQVQQQVAHVLDAHRETNQVC